MIKLYISLFVSLMFILSGCSFNQTSLPDKTIIAENNKIIELKHYNGITIIPKEPKRIVVMDYAILDIMQSFNIKGLDIATSEQLIPEYLLSIKEYYKITDIGNLKNVDIESIYNFKPDLIIINGRQEKYYAQLSKIAPTINTSNRNKSFKENLYFNIDLISKLFNKTDDVRVIKVGIEIKLNEIYKMESRTDKGLIVFFIGNKMHVIGPKSRLSGLPYDMCKLNSVVIDQQEFIPGAPPPSGISYEYIKKANPDYILVIDRDAAIKLSDSIIRYRIFEDNELLQDVNAIKHHRVFYIDSQLWYLSAGGIRSTNLMLDDIHRALSK